MVGLDQYLFEFPSMTENRDRANTMNRKRMSTERVVNKRGKSAFAI
jgi:hypothetical protein